ncbi:hypothetical protein PsorP6_013361 [Peronosclerospora sorghi]|uniref:Uncharacterized protein n=1 Tax=Peronosclerospora sorghi TaxID=230839 RepID=A0ACC0WIK6_9STRA|nr:hypothetical protein PsorP6_013361 [Peronosclerospora sorghi]
MNQTVAISDFQTAADRLKELISFENEELTSGNVPNVQHVIDFEQLHFSASCDYYIRFIIRKRKSTTEEPCLERKGWGKQWCRKNHEIPTVVKILEAVVDEVDECPLSQGSPASMSEFLSWACSIPRTMTPTSRVSCAKVYLRGIVVITRKRSTMINTY